METRVAKSSETSQPEKNIVVEQLAESGAKFKIIGGRTYYANGNDEIVIRVSTEKEPHDAHTYHELTICENEPVVVRVGGGGRVLRNKLFRCGHPKGCGRHYHRECGRAVGCLYYGSGMKLECPVHYQGWEEDGIRFRYEPERAGSDFDRVVAEIRGLLSENEWDVGDRPIVGEINMGAINTLLLIGKYRQQVGDTEFLLLMRDLVDEVLRTVASKGDD
ncbi:hypothetical protein DSL72_000849 [Monilinia vaccinii-corymbosi]|uniref:Uncharacterized protein n=1 Tax=Monilinia vaccinii-corymbosi TaxID=61207 RepID=A0A8A3P6J9_9HELO|nr:hypothetical protein DSL72_000849 [Monilinia vaccinii-corymbosi]